MTYKRPATKNLHGTLLTIILTGILILLSEPVLSQEFDQPEIIGYYRDTGGLATSLSSVADIAASPDGSVYIAGDFKGIMTVGNTTFDASELSAPGGQEKNNPLGLFSEDMYHNGFLVKHRPGKGVQWARQFDQAGAPVSSIAVTTDTSGNVYVLLLPGLDDPFYLTDHRLEVPANTPVLAKLDAEGSVLWAVEVGASEPLPANVAVADLAVDSKGNIYVAGGGWRQKSSRSSDEAPFGFHLAKFDRDGNRLWIVKADHAAATGIALDGSGNLYLSGGFLGDLFIGGLKASNRIDDKTTGIFMARFNTDGGGKDLWTVEQVEEPEKGSIGRLARTDSAYDVATDRVGNVYVTGAFQGTVRYGEKFIEANGPSEIFTAKHRSSGEVEWVRKGGSPNEDKGFAVTLDKAGNVITAATVGIEPYILNYNPAGRTQWFEKVKIATWQHRGALSMTTGPKGGIYFAGIVVEPTTFGARLIKPEAGNGTFFLVRLRP